MAHYDFSDFRNVEVSGIDLDGLSQDELSVLHQQARYCQAMCAADIETLREIVSPDVTYTHMSGMRQTREEYFADIARGRLRYYSIGIESPRVTVTDDVAEIIFISVLDANAYATRGTYRMRGTHRYVRRDGAWIAVNS